MSDAGATGPPLLVFGAAGQVGRELTTLAAARGVPTIATTSEADIADAVAMHRPRLLVNAATPRQAILHTAWVYGTTVTTYSRR